MIGCLRDCFVGLWPPHNDKLHVFRRFYSAGMDPPGLSHDRKRRGSGHAPRVVPAEIDVADAALRRAFRILGIDVELDPVGDGIEPLEIPEEFPEVLLDVPAFGVPPVSYTHLTLPTIYSV